MDIKNLKSTFVSVLSIIGIVLGIPFGVYCSKLTGGASIASVVVFGIVIALAALLAIDRILVSFINPKKLSIIEFIISVICFLMYYVTQD